MDDRSLAQTVAEVIGKHVTLELESIDRTYLNLYIPRLQYERGVASFFRFHRGHTFASSALMAPISRTFVRKIETFVEESGVALIRFQKNQRKHDLAAEHLARFSQQEGVLFVGKAQEKTPVFRTQKRRNPRTGQSYAWLVRSTAMVNHYYFYCVDKDFGPFFIKFCSYFPTTPSCAPTATSTSSGNWIGKGSPTRHWTTASSPATPRHGCRRWRTDSRRQRSMPYFASG